MDSVPLYVAIGAILGIISSIVLLIVHSERLMATIRSHINGACRRLRECQVMFNEYRWWKQYHPSCEIINKGKLVIKKPSNRYYMGLKIEVRYTSRDNRHDSSVDITSVNLDVYNTGKDRDSKPYRLCHSLNTLQTYPIEEDNDGGFPVIHSIGSLPSGGNVVVRYTFEGFTDAPPLVGASTFCKIVAMGEATVGGVSGSRKLKASRKFQVDVDKKYAH